MSDKGQMDRIPKSIWHSHVSHQILKEMVETCNSNVQHKIKNNRDTRFDGPYSVPQAPHSLLLKTF